MTREDIIRMARKIADQCTRTTPAVWTHDYAVEQIMRLIAAEREACARMAEAFHQHGYDFTGDLELHDAIRARGQI